MKRKLIILSSILSETLGVECDSFRGGLFFANELYAHEHFVFDITNKMLEFHPAIETLNSENFRDILINEN
jgi:hypothetical protein